MECAQSGPPEPSVPALTLAAAHRSQRDVRAWLLASFLRLRGPLGTRLASETSLPPGATILLLFLQTSSIVSSSGPSPSLQALPGTPCLLPLLLGVSLTPRPHPSHCCLSYCAAYGVRQHPVRPVSSVVVFKRLVYLFVLLLIFGCAVCRLSFVAAHGL